MGKPFDSSELLARVKTQITLRSHERKIILYAKKLDQMVEERTQQPIYTDGVATLGTFSTAIIHEINDSPGYTGGNAEFLMFLWEAAESIVE